MVPAVGVGGARDAVRERRGVDEHGLGTEPIDVLAGGAGRSGHRPVQVSLPRGHGERLGEHVVEDNDALVVTQVGDRPPEAVEVLPPERLAVARVVPDRCRQQGDSLLGLVTVGRVDRHGRPQPLGSQLGVARVTRHGRLDAGRRRRVGGGGAKREQPSVQPVRRAAVVAVVVGDVVEDLAGLRVPARRPVGDRLLVLHDRVAGCLHVAAAQVVAHVEGLELLDRVRL